MMYRPRTEAPDVLGWDMSDAPPPQDKKTATEILAELVARRKAAGSAGPGVRGGRESERAAAARSAAKSKPALRK
jgi:hypothetical protein